MLDPFLILIVVSIWLATFILSLRQPRLRKTVLKNILVALINTIILMGISFYIDSRESIFYNFLALGLLGIHSVIVLLYTIIVSFIRTSK